MNVLDIAIILLIAYGAYNGWKYGCFSSILSLLGSLFIFVLAFYIKNPLSVLFYENLPFQSFTGMFKGISSMNILVYELVSYLICLIVLATVFGIILKATGIVDKLIKLTFIFALPSKIFGLLIGGLQFYIFVFAGLFVVGQLPFGVKYFKESRYSETIVTKTPLLSSVTNDLYYSTVEIFDICMDYSGVKDKTKGDYDALEVLLKYDIITADSVQTLIDKNKIKIEGADYLVKKYKNRDANNVEEIVKDEIDKMTSTTTTTSTTSTAKKTTTKKK